MPLPWLMLLLRRPPYGHPGVAEVICKAELPEQGRVMRSAEANPRCCRLCCRAPRRGCSAAGPRTPYACRTGRTPAQGMK